MLCPKCKAPLSDTSARCGACGCSLVNAAAIPAPPAPRSNLLLIGIAIAVVLGAYIFLSNSDSGQPKTPEEAVLMPVKALRANDLAALFSTMPKMEQDKARAGWDTVRKQANPMVDAGFAQVMQMLTAPGAVDQLMGMVEPTLKEIDLDEMASQFEMGMRTQNSGPVPIDEAMISGMTDWVAKAGFDDAAKARRALTHVVEAAKSFGVTSAEKLRALQLEDLLAHGSKALPHLKHAMGVYGIDIDTFLDSVRVNSITGTGAKREVQVSFSFLGKVQTVSTTLVEKDGCWFAEEKKGANLRPGPTVPSVSQE